jgi:hypothetical protein
MRRLSAGVITLRRCEEREGGWKGGDAEKRRRGIRKRKLCRKGNFALQVLNSVHLQKED